MSAHTPLPWKAHHAFFFGHDSFQITGTNGDSSPFLCRLTDDTPNFEANARLIAAAPDLLAALKRLSLCVAGMDQFSLDEDFEAARDQARAALAKAKGKL